MREKNIKDYLPFYLGHEAVFDRQTWKISQVGQKYARLVRSGEFHKYVDVHLEDVKPLLRKMESMTEEEWQEIRFHLSPDIIDSVPLVKWSDKPRWVIVLENRVQTNTLKFLDGIELIKRGYDVFQLIESGLALEKQPATV